jgi:ABC-type sugar transport system ATPase subunit
MLKMDCISKSFGNVHALKNVDFIADKGKVHGLIGANGAGKSTLMKILSGILQPDEGQISIDNQRVSFSSPSDAKRYGIGIVPQEMQLVSDMTVEENIMLGQMPCRIRFLVNSKQVREQAIGFMRAAHLEINPSAKVKSLRYIEKVKIEIARVLSLNPKICIFDEVSSTLTPPEVKELFDVVRSLKSHGAAVIYITHRLEELFEICDDITVLRSGENAGVFAVRDLDIERAGEAMVGKSQRKPIKKIAPMNGTQRIVLSLRGLTSEKLFQDVSFDLHEGEILVLCGVVGSGILDLTLALFGVVPTTGGKVLIDGAEIEILSPSHAIHQGVMLLPQNRQDGLVYTMSVRENITLSILDQLRKLRLFLNFKKEQKIVNEWIQGLNIVTPDVNAKVSSLSGGNQQKVILSRLLAAKPRILILQDPTRGVDVSVKDELREILYNLSREGISIIIASSEIPEAIKLQNRILIMHDGRIIRELSGAEATESEVERSLVLAK